MTITKRGAVYHFDAVLGNRRVRCSLGTRDSKIASRLSNRIQFALAEGPTSLVWAELRTVLPLSSFKRLTEGILPDTPLGLTELEQKFYDHVDRRRKLGQIGAGAAHGYDRATKLFFDAALDGGLTKIEDLTSEFVEKHLLTRRESILAKGGSGRGIASDVVALSALFNFAIEEGWLTRSPLKYKPKIPPMEQAVRPFTDEEMAALAAVEKSSLEEAVFCVFQHTGLRCSDVASLLWSAFDFKDCTLRWRTAKNGKLVEIPLSQAIRSVLGPWKIEGEPRVFPGMTEAKLYKMVRSWGTKAGLENCHPQRFRHTFACRLLGKGATLFDVAKLLGDTHAVVDKHYAKWTNGQAERVRELLES